MIELLQQARDRQHVQLASEATENMNVKCQRSPMRAAVQRMRSRSFEEGDEKDVHNGL